jgi:hypothetical protein
VSVNAPCVRSSELLLVAVLVLLCVKAPKLLPDAPLLLVFVLVAVVVSVKAPWVVTSRRLLLDVAPPLRANTPVNWLPLWLALWLSLEEAVLLSVNAPWVFVSLLLEVRVTLELSL